MNELKQSIFVKELTRLINKCSLENTSDTPDFILAEYLKDCLVAFDKTHNRIKKHYNIDYWERIKDENSTCKLISRTGE